MIHRRKKNRKLDERGFRVPPILYVLGILLIVGAFVMLHLNLRCEKIGAQIKALEKRHADLEKSLVNEQYKWANLTDPRRIEALLQQYQINMTWPEERNIVRLRGQGNPLEIQKVVAYRRPMGGTRTVMHD